MLKMPVPVLIAKDPARIRRCALPGSEPAEGQEADLLYATFEIPKYLYISFYVH